jgi:hypothetical protein
MCRHAAHEGQIQRRSNETSNTGGAGFIGSPFVRPVPVARARSGSATEGPVPDKLTYYGNQANWRPGVHDLRFRLAWRPPRRRNCFTVLDHLPRRRHHVLLTAASRTSRWMPAAAVALSLLMTATSNEASSRARRPDADHAGTATSGPAGPAAWGDVRPTGASNACRQSPRDRVGPAPPQLRLAPTGRPRLPPPRRGGATNDRAAR